MLMLSLWAFFIWQFQEIFKFFLAMKSDRRVTYVSTAENVYLTKTSPHGWSKCAWNSPNFPFPWYFGCKSSRYLFLLFPSDFAGPKKAVECQKKFNKRHWCKRFLSKFLHLFEKHKELVIRNIIIQINFSYLI